MPNTFIIYQQSNGWYVNRWQADSDKSASFDNLEMCFGYIRDATGLYPVEAAIPIPDSFLEFDDQYRSVIAEVAEERYWSVRSRRLLEKIPTLDAIQAKSSTRIPDYMVAYWDSLTRDDRDRIAKLASVQRVKMDEAIWNWVRGTR